MSHLLVSRLLACFGMLSIALPGCATAPRVPPGTSMIVSVSKASFYKYGPSQSFGPDYQLMKGQRLTMIERSFGFSRVLVDAGDTGFISNEEIAPAPPLPPAAGLVAPANPRGPTAAPGRSAQKRSAVAPTQGSALFEDRDLPTPPLPELSDPQSQPKFRF